MEAVSTIVLRPRPHNYVLILIGGPFAVISLLFIVWLLLTALGLDSGARFDNDAVITIKDRLILIFVLLVFLSSLTFILSSSWLVAFVRFSKGRILSNDRFELRPVFGKWRSFDFGDIKGYSGCSLPSWAHRRGQGSGIALYRKDGTHVQLNTSITYGLDQFVLELDRRGIPCIGKELCWWWPFMKSRFKFDPK